MKSVLRQPKALLGALILLTFCVIAIVGPVLFDDPTAFVAAPLSPPDAEHWFGTTGQGQDVFAQTIAGSRTSLFIGFIVGITVVLIGGIVGTTAGYFGGRIDDLLSLIINIFLIMPGLPLMVVMAAYLPSGPTTIALVLIITGWAWSARVMRAQTLSLRGQDFVQAAIVCGDSHLRIILFEILPNMLSLMASALIGATVYAIGAQVALEFLGLGDVSQVTWGTNLYWASNDAALLTGSWWTFVPTGACIALVGFGMALMNNAIDEVGNPRLRRAHRFLKALKSAGLEAGTSTPVLRTRATGKTRES